MAATELLRRRCRRLLWAYPAWYRRERGLELLTTLLDTAEPGRRWPARADVADLIRGGIRCRLQLPRGPYPVIVAAAVALFVAIAGSSAAAMASASALASPPTEDEAVAVAGIAMGQPPRNLPGPVVPCTYFCPNEWVAGGDQVVTFDEPFEENAGTDEVTVVYWAPIDEVSSTVARARARLAADGWSVDGVTDLSDGVETFTASKADLSVGLVATRDESGPSVYLRVERSLPALVVAAGVAGLVGGLLVGWMLAAWTLQRHRRHHPIIRVAGLVWAVPTLALTFLTLAYTANYLVAVVGGRTVVPLSLVPLLPAFAGSGILTSLVGPVIGVIMLVSLGLAALPTRRTGAPVAQAPSPGR